MDGGARGEGVEEEGKRKTSSGVVEDWWQSLEELRTVEMNSNN